jgi:hypothetical protein
MYMYVSLSLSLSLCVCVCVCLYRPYQGYPRRNQGGDRSYKASKRAVGLIAERAATWLRGGQTEKMSAPQYLCSLIISIYYSTIYISRTARTVNDMCKYKIDIYQYDYAHTIGR